jgi:hypothetical protein
VTTYSRLLWQGTFPTTSTDIYTVAAGVTAVLRDIELASAATGDTGLFLTTSVPGFDGSAIFYNLPTQPGFHFQWQGRIVLPPGSALQGLIGLANVFGVISGYELTA